MVSRICFSRFELLINCFQQQLEPGNQKKNESCRIKVFQVMLIDVHRWMDIIFPVWIDPSFSRGTRDKQFISFSFFFYVC